MVWFVVRADDDDDVESERTQQLQASWRCAREHDAAKRLHLVVRAAGGLDESARMEAARVAVCPMDDAAERVKLVLTLNDAAFVRCQRNRAGEADVRFDAKQQIARVIEFHQKPFMFTAWSIARAEHLCDRAGSDDFDM